MLQKLQVDLESAQLAKQRLETDNLALYSKIKYLQSYGASANGAAAGGIPYRSPQVSILSCTYAHHTHRVYLCPH
jgi:hypothetical protein